MSSNVSNIKLNQMPLPTLGFISSFFSPQEARAVRLVCKRLNNREYTNGTPPVLSNVSKQEIEPAKTLQGSIPLQVLNHMLRFTPRPEQLHNQVVCTSFREAQLIPPTALHLHHSDMTDEQLSAILDQRGDKYAYISISDCPNLTGKSIARIAKLKQLRSLDLSNNKFTDNDLLPLKGSNIRSLNLSYCKNLSGKCFLVLRHLVRLNLTGCSGLKSVSFDALRGCQGLIILILSKTQVNDTNMKNIQRLKNIRKVDVSYCPKLTDDTVLLFKRQVEDGLNLVTTGCRNIHLTLKIRHEKSDFRHSIRAPLPEDVNNDARALTDLDEWKKALQEKRIGELFKTSENLPGHVVAVSTQIARFPRSAGGLDGRSGTVVCAAIQTLKDVRESLVKSMQGVQDKFNKGQQGGFALPKAHTITFPTWSGVPDLLI